MSARGASAQSAFPNRGLAQVPTQSCTLTPQQERLLTHHTEEQMPKMGSEPCGVPVAPVASPWLLWHRWLCTGPEAPQRPSFCTWMSDSTRLTGMHPATWRWANTVAPMTKLTQHSGTALLPQTSSVLACPMARHGPGAPRAPHLLQADSGMGGRVPGVPKVPVALQHKA